jgi:hypothetical protein
MILKLLKPLAALSIACGLLLSAGCTASNESAADIEGVEATPPGGGPPPKDQRAFMEQQKQAGGGSSYSGRGYPGAQ